MESFRPAKNGSEIKLPKLALNQLVKTWLQVRSIVWVDIGKERAKSFHFEQEAQSDAQFYDW